eukprot:Em0006g1387a
MRLERVLTSDQGTEFHNQINEELMTWLKVDHRRLSTAYHPQTNGLDERFNQTIQLMLAKFCSDRHSTWETHLDACTFEYNTSRQESTNYSPFELMFGRKPVLPVELDVDDGFLQIISRWPSNSGLDLTPQRAPNVHCAQVVHIDHLGHHAVTCKYGGDVVSRHNRIRDILVETCRRAHIGVKVEVGNNLSRDHSKTRPADILLPNWFLGRTAALDVSITSPLNPVTLLEAGVSATAAAQATEARKHQANDPKCSELGWVCVPMVVETYGAGERKPQPSSLL